MVYPCMAVLHGLPLYGYTAWFTTVWLYCTVYHIGTGSTLNLGWTVVAQSRRGGVREGVFTILEKLRMA